jgi:serine protease Do
MAVPVSQRLLIALCAVCVSYNAQAQAQLVIGTATFLNKSGDLLTNRHVVDGCKSLAIRTRQNKFYAARVVAQSSKFDLAVISETGFVPEATVSLSVNSQRYVYIPIPGMKLLYGGFDYADPDPTMPVDISNGEAVEGGEGLDVSRMRSGADHGSSGSGVFDDSGNMVGVIFSGYIDLYPTTTPENFYGYNVINFYNNNAVVEFLQKELSIELAYSEEAPPIPRIEAVGKTFASTALVVCQQ